jgi:hypothetical protein
MGGTLQLTNMVDRSFRKQGEFVARSIAGETILVPVRSRIGDLESIYNLNEVGSFIWKALDTTASLRDIAQAVSVEFDVSVETAIDDTREFLAILESAGLVVGI